MDEEEYKNKYTNLRILKNIQDYLKSEDSKDCSVYPIRVPEELLYQTLKLKGAKNTDNIIHHIFKLGLNVWSEKVYDTVFGSKENLEEFIEAVKNRNKEDR